MTDERDRLANVYGEYAASGRRQRAWDADSPANIAIRAELRASLLEVAADPLSEGGAILDVGCGGGYWLRELAAAGVKPSRLHGVDLLPERVAAASRSLPGSNIRSADARRLPFREGDFSLVLMLTALSSMPDRAAARAGVREGLRVLRPGGLLVVYEPARGMPGSSRMTITPEHLREWCGAEAKLRSVERMTVLPPLARPLGRLSARTYAPLARAPFLLTHRLTALQAAPRP